MTALRSTTARWIVHLGMLVTVVVALLFETVLTVHIVVGLVFVGLVVGHLAQRRTTAARLGSRLVHLRGLSTARGRLALADGLLALVTVVMLVSGIWDWSSGHPTHIRWHAVSGVVLLAAVAVHTLRRRKRLRTSRVR